MNETRNITLSKYRLEKAETMLITSRRDMDCGDYSSANNRAYYCIFHSVRSVLALAGLDFKSHKALMIRFMNDYLRTDELPRHLGRIISEATEIRHNSDYQDFYECTKEETSELISSANEFFTAVKSYLLSKYEESENSLQTKDTENVSPARLQESGIIYEINAEDEINGYPDPRVKMLFQHHASKEQIEVCNKESRWSEKPDENDKAVCFPHKPLAVRIEESKVSLTSIGEYDWGKETDP